MVRLYIGADDYVDLVSSFDQSFIEQQKIFLSSDHIHYLRNVLRFSVGDSLIVYNERQGEWSARIDSLSKNSGTICLLKQERIFQPLPVAQLLFSPLKHDPLLFLLEKATELGVTHLHPVLTNRTVVTKINREKIYRNCVEASQQCERLDVPVVSSLQSLKSWVSAYCENDHFHQDIDILLVCQERGQDRFIGEVLKSLYEMKQNNSQNKNISISILVGPEGGFTTEELSWLGTFPFVQFCHLGPCILRAETAAVYALTALQVCRTLFGIQSVNA